MLDCSLMTEPTGSILQAATPDRDTVWMTAAEVAERQRKEETTLANERHRGEGIPFTKLPSGGIRYNLEDVLAYEKSGLKGFTWSRLNDALALMPGLSSNDRQAIVSHLKKHM